MGDDEVLVAMALCCLLILGVHVIEKNKQQTFAVNPKRFAFFLYDLSKPLCSPIEFMGASKIKGFIRHPSLLLELFQKDPKTSFYNHRKPPK